jgi:hypothetical protein
MHRDGMGMHQEAGDACGVGRHRDMSRRGGVQRCVWYQSCGRGAVAGRTAGVLGLGDSCMHLQLGVSRRPDVWWCKFGEHDDGPHAGQLEARYHDEGRGQSYEGRNRIGN